MISSVYAGSQENKSLYRESKKIKKEGWKLYHTGDYASAKQKFQKYISLEEKRLKKDELGATYSNICIPYIEMRDYKTAVEYCQKAIDVYEKLPGKKKLGASAAYANLSRIYEELKDYNKALLYKQKALAMVEKSGKLNKHIIPLSNNEIATLYEKLNNYPKALEYYQKSLAIFQKDYGENHSQTAKTYNQIGNFYYKMGDYQKTSEYYKKALVITEKLEKDKSRGNQNFLIALEYARMAKFYDQIGDLKEALVYHKKEMGVYQEYGDTRGVFLPTTYNNIAVLYDRMKDYKKSLEYFQKALELKEKGFGKTNPDTVVIYSNIAGLYQKLGDFQNSLIYHKKALKGSEEGCGKNHPYTASVYSNLSLLYIDLEDYPKAHHYAQLTFNNFLANRDQIFTILDMKEKEKYLKGNIVQVALLLHTTYAYLVQLKKEKNNTQSQQVLQSGANAWLNYKGSIFDSENAIAMLYNSTKDPELKAKIDDLIGSKRYLAQLYQLLPKPEEREAWKSNIEETEEKISKLTNEISSKATSFKEQQGLQSIDYKDITSHLKIDELYIDFAKVGENYYLFSLDSKENITFIQIDKNNTKKIDTLVQTFRDDVNTILNDNNMTNIKLEALTKSSKEKLSNLYELILKEPLGDMIKNKTSLIISPDGALRLLPFEALYDKENNKYFIEEKEIRYIPSGKELVRLYKYSTDKVAESTSVIFANPDFDTKVASLNQEQIAITPNTNRSGIIKSLFMMRFDALPGTEAEAKAIKATLNQKTILEYQTNKATESTLMKVKEPKILHIATHGFFINDNTIPNPMLKSGIALAGANTSAIRGESDGIVTALKLSGLDLKGTDLVVLSACQTGVVDINETDSVSGLSKAFIQAGAKDIVMSLWSVDDQATKELMTSFYEEMKQNRNYANALKAAKLKIIEEGRHPFYWAAFVVSGL